MAVPEVRRSVPALVAGFTIAIVFAAVLSIVLTAAGPHGMSLSARRTSGWIALIYGFPMIPSPFLTFRYRMPLLLTGNVFALIFFASLGGRETFEELTGAAMLAGAILLVTAVLGVTGRVASWIPTPVVQGLIAGTVFPFVIGVFSSLATSSEGKSVPIEVPIMVGAAVLAFLASQRALGPRVPAILAAFVVGLVVAAVTGQLGSLPPLFGFPSFDPVRPELSWAAILTITPVLLAVMTVQSNVPSVIYLRSQGFDPPERLINVISGGGTVVASLFGPVMVSLALPPQLLAAGPGAGDREIRYRAAIIPIAASLLIALFAGTAADIAVLIPPVLLLTMAGLALLPALTSALRDLTAGPLLLGPLFAFAIALSDMSLFGLGKFFWSLVIGTAVSVVFEREGWRELRAARAAV
jgi:benzoate membrane transport protein